MSQNTRRILGVLVLVLVAAGVVAAVWLGRLSADGTVESGTTSETTDLSSPDSQDTTAPVAPAPGSPESSAPSEGEVPVPPGRPRPTSPAETDAPLTSIEMPPEATLAMLNADAMEPNTRYSIVFMPYGIGPDRGNASSIVIRISEAVTDSRSAPSLVGRNVLAETTPMVLEAVPVGGEYQGTLVFILRDGRWVPFLHEAESR